MNRRSIMFLSILPVLWAGAADADDDSAEKPEEPAFLGVMLGEVPDILRSHLGVDGGALVQQVLPGSPAEKAGLRQFDVLLAIGDAKIAKPDRVKELVQKHRAGDEVVITIGRAGKQETVKATLGTHTGESLPAPVERPREPGFLGVGYGEVPQVLAFHLRLEEGRGVVVGDVLEDSAAAKAGIVTNDVIVALDGYEVKGPEDFVKILADLKAGDEVRVELIHRGEKKAVNAVLDKRPPHAEHPLPLELNQWRAPWHPALPHFRGGMKLIEPGGKERVFIFPEGPWSGESFDRWIEEHLKNHDFKKVDKEIKERMKSLLERSKSGLHLFDHGAADAGKGKVISKRVFKAQASDGKETIEITSEDGQTVVTRTSPEGKITTYEFESEEGIETLPEDLRKKVKALMKKEHGPREKKPQQKKLELKLKDVSDKKIRA